MWWKLHVSLFFNTSQLIFAKKIAGSVEQETLRYNYSIT